MKTLQRYLAESDDNLSKFVRKLKNLETGQTEYAFINIHKDESDPHYVLKWFGTSEPSDEEVEKELRAIEYFKHNA